MTARRGGMDAVAERLALVFVAVALLPMCFNGREPGCGSGSPSECDRHEDCPKGERCDLHPVPDAPSHVCVDRAGEIGRLCETSCAVCSCDSEVVCVPEQPDASTGTCQLDCTSDALCPDGFVCSTTDGGIVDHCIPAPDAGD